jgi:hypothetical protein
MRKAKAAVADTQEKRWANAGVLLPPLIHQQLKASAARENRSLSGQIRHIVELYLSREDTSKSVA